MALGGAWGWSLFGVVWGLAAAGITMKLFFTGRFEVLYTICYVVMGWIMLLAIGPMVKALSVSGIVWLFTGGGIYTLGSYNFV